MRRYEPGDLAELNAWHAARWLAPLRAGSLPAVGYIEPGVAAGFLYRTDSDLALLDGYITSPAATARARHRAVAAITEALLGSARTDGIRSVVGLCRSPGVARHAIRRHGMQALGRLDIVSREV
jgi:hypothetical protein